MDPLLSRREFLQTALSAGLLALLPAGLVQTVAADTRPRFALGHIDGILGSSVIYEERKGDYAEAMVLARRAVSDAEQSGADRSLADALLRLGIAELLAGAPGRAFGRFEDSERLAPGDTLHVLWSRTYRLAAFMLQFNTFPDGTAAEGDEINHRLYSAQSVERSRVAGLIRSREDAALPLSSDRAVLEAEFVTRLYHMVVLVRDFASGDYARPAQGQRDPMYRNAAVQSYEAVYGTAEALAIPQLQAYLALLAADGFRRLGEHDQANEYLAKCEELYGAAGDAVAVAAAHLLEGDWAAAPLSTPAVLNFALSASPNSDSGISWAHEAAELDLTGVDLDRARAAYAQAERGFRRTGARRGLAALALRRGYLAMRDGDYRAAGLAAAEAEKGFRASGDGLGLRSAKVHRALAQIGDGDFPGDLESARAVGAWGRGEGSFSYALGLGMVCGRAGRHWLLQAGDYERALACHRLAEALYAALGAEVNVAQSIVDQGLVFRDIGEAAAAVTLLGRAVDVYGAAAGAGSALAKAITGRLVALLNELFQVYVANRDPDGMERVATDLAAMIDGLQTGNALTGETSVDDIQTWTRVAFQGRALIVQAATLAPVVRGIQAKDDGDPARAERLFDTALEAARGSEAAGADRDFLEAIVHRARKDYPAAQQAFERYITRLLDGEGVTGRLLALMRQLSSERAVDEQVKQQQRTHEQAVSFLVSVEAYGAAHEHLTQLEAIAGNTWWRNSERPWEELGNYGLVYEGLGDHQQAGAYYDRAIELLEQRRARLRRDELKTALASGIGPQWLYFRAARNALRTASAAERAGGEARGRSLRVAGFGYAERGKARGLLDLMSGSAAGTTREGPASTAVRRWREANARLTAWRGLLATERAGMAPEPARLAFLGERIEREDAGLRELERDLATSDPGFHQLVSPQDAVMDVAAVAALLPSGTALLQYYFLGDDLLLWAVDAGGIRQVRHISVDAKALAREIRILRSRCEDREPTEAAAESVAQALLAPMREVIAVNRDLILVPYGAAHALPFHVLPWDGQPLVASHSISYLPSASALQFLRGRGKGVRTDRVLAVGDPAEMSYQPPLGGSPVPQPPLPAARIEALLVAGLFPGGRALIGGGATAENVRKALPEYRVLHFATHGHLSEDAPLLSAILLARGSALTVHELLGLRLDADLVVLSACRTGQGQATGGDDVLGLTRGLLAAGARSALVSLWPVDDLATSLLMEYFYAGLHEGSAPESALREAQNRLRGLSPEEIRAGQRRVADATRGQLLISAEAPAKDYRHPYYWAPFILVG